MPAPANYPKAGSRWQQKGHAITHRVLGVPDETWDYDEVATVTDDLMNVPARTFSWLGPLDEFKKQFLPYPD